MSNRSALRAAVAALALLACGATTLASAGPVVRPVTGSVAQPAAITQPSSAQSAQKFNMMQSSFSSSIKAIGDGISAMARKG